MTPRADINVIIASPGVFVPRIDIGGIYVLETTGKYANTSANTTTLDYGINPCQWRALPNEGVMVWKVRHPVSTGEEAYPVTVVVPTSGSSTVNDPNTTTGTNKVPVVDHKGTQVQGDDVTNTEGPYTEHWVYFNKNAGIFRLMGVQTTGGNTPASAATNSK